MKLMCPAKAKEMIMRSLTWKNAGGLYTQQTHTRKKISGQRSKSVKMEKPSPLYTFRHSSQSTQVVSWSLLALKLGSGIT